MSLPQYSAYKDSGVAWLGEVPAHWHTSKLKWLANKYAGGTPNKLNLEFWTDGTIPWLNSGSVNDGLITEPSNFITESALKNSSAKWIPKGALVMALAGQGKTKGMVAQLAIDTTCNQSMAAIIPNKNTCPRFLFWWLTSNYQNIRNLAGGDLRDGLNLEILGDIQCPLVFIQEQQAIVDFLDRETAKIDALVAEQEMLIALLKEKRQAMISHAVTKGLNPNAPMKDSGIEWLGEVPAHWDVKKIKKIFNVGRGRVIAQDELIDDALYPVFSSQTVDNGCLGYINTFDFDCKQITWTTDGANAGTVFLREGKHNCTNVCGTLQAKDDSYLIEYVYYYLGYATQFYKRPDTNGAKIMNNEMAVISVSMPPFAEQQAITAFLNNKTSKIDTLTAEANRAIALLKERRSALISAAVTGKINVSAFSPQPAMEPA